MGKFWIFVAVVLLWWPIAGTRGAERTVEERWLSSRLAPMSPSAEAKALVEMKPELLPAVADRLAQMLRDGQPWVIDKWESALAGILPPRAKPGDPAYAQAVALTAAMLDRQGLPASMRALVIKKLASSGEYDLNPVAAHIVAGLNRPATQGEDPSYRRELLKRLAGSATYPATEKTLALLRVEYADRSMTGILVSEVVRGEPFETFLLYAAQEGSPSVRIASMNRLGELKKHSAALRACLRAGLADTDGRVRWAALEAVLNTGWGHGRIAGAETGSPLAPDVVRLLCDESDNIRRGARQVLHQGLDLAEVIDALVSAAEDKDAALRGEAWGMLVALRAPGTMPGVHVPEGIEMTEAFEGLLRRRYWSADAETRKAAQDLWQVMLRHTPPPPSPTGGATSPPAPHVSGGRSIGEAVKLALLLMAAMLGFFWFAVLPWGIFRRPRKVALSPARQKRLELASACAMLVSAGSVVVLLIGTLMLLGMAKPQGAMMAVVLVLAGLMGAHCVSIGVWARHLHAGCWFDGLVVLVFTLPVLVISGWDVAQGLEAMIYLNGPSLAVVRVAVMLPLLIGALVVVSNVVLAWVAPGVREGALSLES